MDQFKNNGENEVRQGMDKEDKEKLSSNTFRNNFFNYDFSNIKHRSSSVAKNEANKDEEEIRELNSEDVIIEDDNAEATDDNDIKENSTQRKSQISQNEENMSHGNNDNVSNINHIKNIIAEDEEENELIINNGFPSDPSIESETEETVEEEKTVPKAEFDILKDGYLRLKADFENYKKNNKDVGTKMYNEGKTDTLINIFPVLDSFELGIAHGSEEEIKGLQAIYRQFVEILNKMKVIAIDEVGVDFDPNIHDAVMRVEDSENSGKVVEILKKGYKSNDKVLRYAMVKVAQ